MSLGIIETAENLSIIIRATEKHKTESKYLETLESALMHLVEYDNLKTGGEENE